MFTEILHNKKKRETLHEKQLIIDTLKKFVDGLEPTKEDSECEARSENYEPAFSQFDLSRIFQILVESNFEHAFRYIKADGTSINPYDSDDEGYGQEFNDSLSWIISIPSSREVFTQRLDEQFERIEENEKYDELLMSLYK